MKTLYRWMFIVLIAVAISGCSFRSRIIIANTSSENITVSWSFRDIPCEKKTVFEVTSSESISNRRLIWAEGKGLIYRCDTQNNVGIIEIPANTAVLLVSPVNQVLIGNYRKLNLDKEYFLNIEGSEGVINFTGYQVEKAFKKVRRYRNRYVLSY